MAYCDPDLKWDIFVSYAHVDDLEGWVDRFHKQLSVKLDMLVGRAGEVQIWRDPKLDESQAFDSVIFQRLKDSALFLAVCSNGYLRSEYCGREFEAFKKRFTDTDLQVGDRSRMLRLRLHNIPYDQLPGASFRTGAFDFFTAEDKDDIGTPLDTSVPDFRAKADHLAKVTFTILKDLRARVTTAPLPPPRSSPKGEVFLAEVCDTQRIARKRLEADLGALGVTVMSRVPPPYGAAPHEAFVRSALAGCRLAVHLFDSWSDNPIEDLETTTYGREQLRLARERKLPQIIWIPQRVPLGEQSTRESLDAGWIDFLNKLEGAERDEDQYRIVRCPPSELASLVAGRVKELREKPRAGAPAQPAVLLDTHHKDELVAYDVCKALVARGVRPHLNAEGDDPRENSAIFADRLKQVQGLLILFGQAREEWVRARLGEALKLIVTSRYSLKFCGILLAPPDVGQDQAAFEYPLLKTHVLDNRRGLDPETLGPVLQGLGVG